MKQKRKIHITAYGIAIAFTTHKNIILFVENSDGQISLPQVACDEDNNIFLLGETAVLFTGQNFSDNVRLFQSHTKYDKYISETNTTEKSFYTTLAGPLEQPLYKFNCFGKIKRSFLEEPSENNLNDGKLPEYHQLLLKKWLKFSHEEFLQLPLARAICL